MTASNLYVDFRSKNCFKEVEALVNNLPQRIHSIDSDVFDSFTESQKSILEGVYWNKMNRTGIIKPKGPDTYVNYEYERPEVCITISAKYASSSKSLQEVNVQLHLSSPIDRTIYDDYSYDTTHIEFVISPHQNVKYTVV